MGIRTVESTWQKPRAVIFPTLYLSLSEKEHLTEQQEESSSWPESFVWPTAANWWAKQRTRAIMYRRQQITTCNERSLQFFPPIFFSYFPRRFRRTWMKTKVNWPPSRWSHRRCCRFGTWTSRWSWPLSTSDSDKMQLQKKYKK